MTIPNDINTARFAELSTLVRELDDIIKYQIGKARSLPAMYAGNVDRLTFSMPSYGAREMDPDQLHACRLAKDIAIGAERERGEADRDKTLAEISLRLEAIRAVLPGLAADTAIELGVVARGLS